jgi:hypothetical protein
MCVVTTSTCKHKYSKATKTQTICTYTWGNRLCQLQEEFDGEEDTFEFFSQCKARHFGINIEFLNRWQHDGLYILSSLQVAPHLISKLPQIPNEVLIAVLVTTNIPAEENRSKSVATCGCPWQQQSAGLQGHARLAMKQKR